MCLYGAASFKNAWVKTNKPPRPRRRLRPTSSRTGETFWGQEVRQHQDGFKKTTPAICLGFEPGRQVGRRTGEELKSDLSHRRDALNASATSPGTTQSIADFARSQIKLGGQTCIGRRQTGSDFYHGRRKTWADFTRRRRFTGGQSWHRCRQKLDDFSPVQTQKQSRLFTCADSKSFNVFTGAESGFC